MIVAFISTNATTGLEGARALAAREGIAGTVMSVREVPEGTPISSEVAHHSLGWFILGSRTRPTRSLCFAVVAP
jgi:hypothetical protein